MIRHRRLGRAFSLVELMIVVAIIGVLSTLAIQGVRRYLANAKTAEARNALGSMAKLAAMAFDLERSASTAVMTQGGTVAAVKQFCTSATAPVPAVTSVKGVKYQSKPTDWAEAGDTTGLKGFPCLRFTVDTPQAFSYDYKGVNGASSTFTALAYGDLNGDGTTSTFSIAGQADNNVARYAPVIAENHPEE